LKSRPTILYIHQRNDTIEFAFSFLDAITDFLAEVKEEYIDEVYVCERHEASLTNHLSKHILEKNPFVISNGFE